MSRKLLMNNIIDTDGNGGNTPILNGLTHWFTNEIDYTNKQWINKIDSNNNMNISNTDCIIVSGNCIGLSTGVTNHTIELLNNINIQNGFTVQLIFYKLTGHSWSEFMKVENFTIGYRIYSSSQYVRVTGITGSPMNVFDGLNIGNYEVLKSISYGFDSQRIGNIAYVDNEGLSSVYDNLTAVLLGNETTFALLKNVRLEGTIKDILIYNRVLSKEELQQNLNY